MSDFVFKVDRDVVTEGDVVTVAWACPGALSAMLVLDNGYKAASMSVEAIGSKKFRLNRSKGKTKIVLETTDAKGKTSRKVLKVRVKELEYTKAEEVGAENPFKKYIREIPQKIKLSWSALDGRKKMAYIVIWSILLTLLLSLINPIFMQIGLTALMFYLAWVLLKK